MENIRTPKPTRTSKTRKTFPKIASEAETGLEQAQFMIIMTISYSGIGISHLILGRK